MHYISDFFVTMYREMPIFFYVYMTILGLLVGSFLNVVIYRLPIMLEREWKDEYQDYFHPEKPLPKHSKFNLLVPRSHCPNCNHKITAWENIPLLSYIFLGGKCSECKNKISMRYPLVELFTGLVTLYVTYHFGASIKLVTILFFVWGLIAISGIDFDKQIIPDEIVFPLMWLGIICNTYNGGIFVPTDLAIYGAVFGYFVPWSIYCIYKLIRGKEGMGHGDFKLYAMIGAWLGVYMLPALILLSSLIGAIFGVIFLFNRKKNIPFAFGPYIAIAGFVMLVFGEKINAWYLTQITH